VGPRAGLDDLEKRKFLTLPGLEIRPLSCPARSQSLYRLRYPDSPIETNICSKFRKLVTYENNNLSVLNEQEMPVSLMINSNWVKRERERDEVPIPTLPAAV
jgi:hypothetical protein